MERQQATTTGQVEQPPANEQRIELNHDEDDKRQHGGHYD